MFRRVEGSNGVDGLDSVGLDKIRSEIVLYFAKRIGILTPRVTREEKKAASGKRGDSTYCSNFKVSKAYDRKRQK